MIQWMLTFFKPLTSMRPVRAIAGDEVVLLAIFQEGWEEAAFIQGRGRVGVGQIGATEKGHGVGRLME